MITRHYDANGRHYATEHGPLIELHAEAPGHIALWEPDPNPDGRRIVRLDNHDATFEQTGGPIEFESQPLAIPALTEEQRAELEERFRKATEGLKQFAITIQPVLEEFVFTLGEWAEAVRRNLKFLKLVDRRVHARRKRMHCDYRQRQLARRRRR